MGMSAGTKARYVELARERGADRRFGGGTAVVDFTRDPVLDKDVVLLSHVDERLWTDREFLRWFAAEVQERQVVVRAVEPPPIRGDWSEYIHYIRLDDLPDLSGRTRGDVVVRPLEGDAERAFVRDCLCRAIEAGYDPNVRCVDGVVALAEELLSDDGVVSYVAVDSGGRLVGQITYRSLSDDECATIHGARTELVDAYSVERPATPVIDELVAASIGSVARPVLGTVSAADGVRRDAILADLRRDGWVSVISDWVADR